MIEKDYKKILDGVKFPHGLKRRQTMRILFWSMFNGKRFDILIDCIEAGMALKPAYDRARQNKPYVPQVQDGKCICEMQPGVSGFCHEHKTDWM